MGEAGRSLSALPPRPVWRLPMLVGYSVVEAGSHRCRKVALAVKNGQLGLWSS